MQLIKESIQVPQLFSVQEDVEEKRNNLILESLKITAITHPASQQLAVDAARDIRTYIKNVEATRVELTRPLLEAQRLLKALADDHVGPLKDELNRVERMVTQFQRAEAERVAAEQAALRRQYEEAEQARIKAEQEAQKAAERVNTQTQLNRSIQKEKLAEQAKAQVQAVIAQPVPVAAKAKGATLRQVLKWEVTDIYALVQARPDLCKIEPKASAIQSTCVPEMPNLPPGLKLWWEDATSIRSR